MFISWMHFICWIRGDGTNNRKHQPALEISKVHLPT